VALLRGMWRGRKAHPFVSFGIAWFLLLLLPSSLLVILDRGELMAEHRVYLASLGVFLAAGVVIDKALGILAARGISTRLMASAGFVVIALSLGGRTMLRNQLWSNPLAVWLE